MSTDKHVEACVPVPQLDKACAIVILFYPDSGFRERLARLLAQFESVVLIDNTPDLRPLGRLPHNVHLVRNGRNLGVAAALNQGVRFALQKGHTWVATFDQDSDLLPGYLEKVIAVAKRQAPKAVVVGCNYFQGNSDQARYTFRRSSSHARRRLVLITSGTFMPAQFVFQIGGFREDYFIDSVDHEFCLRANQQGAAILMTTQPFLRHQIGSSGVGLGLVVSFQHQPFRRYYISRNALATIRGYGLRHPLWATRQVGRLAAEAFAIIAFESGKREKLGFFMRGLLHGMVGKSGPLGNA